MTIISVFQTNLISKNPDGASSWNLVLSKPYWGKVRRNTKNKHCGYWAHKLSKEGHWEHIWTGTANFYPGTDAVEGWPDKDNIPDSPVVQEPKNGQNKGHVSEQVDHR